jgi:formamidopyrimidine-DNA glycosylase
MPELPEVETVRRRLADAVVGQRVTAVTVRRRSVVVGPITPAALLVGKTIAAVERRGKEMAILGQTGRVSGADRPCVCVHLGMTGSLRYHSALSEPVRVGPVSGTGPTRAGSLQTHDRHCHVRWTLSDGGVIVFRDPRRFGGLWTVGTAADRDRQRWSRLGPDALTIRPGELRRRIGTTTRGLKAVLLDQTILAGMGNIYVDELLFTCGLHPRTPAAALDANTIRTLVTQMRALLALAIAANGSSVRDYTAAEGEEGEYQARHRVYGRGGQPCTRRRCQTTLHQATIAGRTTVFCPQCQPLATGRAAVFAGLAIIPKPGRGAAVVTMKKKK